MKYEVEFARYTTVIIDAENKKEAEEKANIMDDEEIKKYGCESQYSIFDIRQK